MDSVDRIINILERFSAADGHTAGIPGHQGGSAPSGSAPKGVSAGKGAKGNDFSKLTLAQLRKRQDEVHAKQKTASDAYFAGKPVPDAEIKNLDAEERALRLAVDKKAFPRKKK
jgi:hypothetical protein